MKTDNLGAVHKILRTFERAMDYPEFELSSQIGPEQLRVSEERWARYIEMLADEGFIKGVGITTNAIRETCAEDNGARITLRGLEYLAGLKPLSG